MSLLIYQRKTWTIRLHIPHCWKSRVAAYISTKDLDYTVKHEALYGDLETEEIDFILGERVN